MGYNAPSGPLATAPGNFTVVGNLTAANVTTPGALAGATVASVGSVALSNGLGVINEFPGSTTPAGSTLWFCAGLPPAGMGANGDFALRFDGTTAGHTVMYHKEAGAWAATAA
jgi:hypothetical protein